MRHGRDTSGDRQRRRELEAQTRLRTHLAVTRVLAEAGSLAEAAPQVLEAICRRLGWELGALWTVDGEAGVLRCVDLWHVPASPLVGFTLATRQSVFRRGEGLPGRVWEEGAARWVPDVGPAAETPRSSTAAREGVRAALAFPIESHGELLGVMEFFSAEVREPDDDLIDMLTGVGSQVGQFVLQREGEREVRDSEARKSAIVNAALDCIVSIDAEGRITEFNPAAEATFGFSRAQAIGQPLAGLLIPDRLRGEHMSAFGRYLAGGEPRILGKRFEAVGLRANGEEFPLELTITQVDIPGPPVFTGYLRDLTDSQRAERAARDLAAIVESTEDAIMSGTLDGVILTWNRGAELLYGYTAEQAIGQPVTMLLPAGRAGEAPEILARVATGERINQLETVHHRQDGSSVDVALTVSPVLGHGGIVVGASAIARDITERKRALAQIAHLAYYDQLTGLPNRAMFHEHLELALARADRNGMAVAVLFIDLDNFKLVNDSFGHVAGDTLLHDFGMRLKAVTRATDIVARQGGDEFLVLVPDLELHGGDSLEPRALEVVAAIEEKVRKVLSTPFQVANTEVHVGLSIGVSVYPIDAADRDELLRNADTAMYVGKGLHLVRQEPAEPQAQAQARERLAMITDLRNAVEQGGFELHYQPIVDLSTRQLVGVETLVRWRDHDQRLVLPEQFIPLAERHGLIESITQQVIEGAVGQAREWRDRGADLVVTFNLPPGLWGPEIVESLIETADREGLEPHRIMIEVTESTVMVQPPRASRTLALLREHGVRLAIDDFGTGHSSLGRLRELPVSTLKIDRSFVADLPSDRGAAAIVAAIIQLSHNLGLQPLAEGIETQAQLEFLLEHGCHLGQGYLLGRPVPAEELELTPV